MHSFLKGSSIAPGKGKLVAFAIHRRQPMTEPRGNYNSVINSKCVLVPPMAAPDLYFTVKNDRNKYY